MKSNPCLYYNQTEAKGPCCKVHMQLLHFVDYGFEKKVSSQQTRRESEA